MGQREYLIGDVARMSGVSRDTVRFYEKKGLITSHKRANGYRYYTEDELMHLYGILYRRQMNFSLENIEKLWNRDLSLGDYEKALDAKILEEEEEIRQRQMVVAQLKATRQDCDAVSRQLHTIEIRRFPKGFVLKDCSSHTDAMICWFSMAQERPELAVSYIFNNYRYQSGFSLPGGGREDGSALTLESASLLYLPKPDPGEDPEAMADAWPATEPVSCIFTTAESDSCEPDLSVVEAMREWGLERGLIPMPRVISAYILRRMREGEPLYYLDIYIPVFSGTDSSPL